MNGEFAREFVAAARRFDGIDVADQVGDGYIGCGEFFDIAILGSEVGNGRLVAETRDLVAAAPADGSVRVVVNLAAGEVGHVRIEQRGESAQDAAFGLAAQSEKNEIVTREDRVNDLRHDRIFVADDAGKNGSVAAVAQAGDEIVAQFVLDAPCAETFFGKSTVAQFAQRARKTHEGNPQGQILSPIIRAFTMGRDRASTGVAVASRLLARAHGTSEVGHDGFEVRDERGDALTL